MVLSSVSPGDVIRSTPDINQYKDHLEGAVGNELAWFLRVLALNNFTIRLSDDVGAQSFILQDSAGVVIFEIDSNGVIEIGGVEISDASANLSSADGATFGPSAVTSITVRNGIITAIS